MSKINYRVWVKLKDETTRTRHTSDLVSCFKHFDKDLSKWLFAIVYDKKSNQELGKYFNYPNNNTRPQSKKEL